MMNLCNPQNAEEETFVKLVRIAKITYSLNHPQFLKDTNIDNGNKKRRIYYAIYGNVKKFREGVQF